MSIGAMSIGGGGGPFCVRARRSPTLPAPKKSSIAFAVEGRVTRTDIPGLCAALALVLEESGGEVVECEVGALVRADASVVEALARLQLVALRRGSRIRLWNASQELCELIDLMGLRGPMSSNSARL
jgi:ABC-type transporter Mla MlaB component